MTALKRVSFFARPELLLVTAVVGAFVAVVSAIVLAMNGERGVIRSMLVGVAVGLPAMLYVKWGMGKHIGFYARFFTMPLSERLSWPVQKKNWLYGWPSFVIWPALIIVSEWLGTSVICAWAVAWILMILVYPEQKAIYEAAKARLEEAE